MNTENVDQIFPKGNKITNGYFVGDAYLQTLFTREKNKDFVIGSVTFEPGARTNWHTHPKGQVLLVTEGEGFYQEKGKSARKITKGDVVSIPDNVEHWHGASTTHTMVHIAITNLDGETTATWLQAVSSEEYDEVNKH